MTTLSIIALTVGIVGLAFGGKCYFELWKWAKLCQRGRIVIAYNRKVQINAPLTEWLQWTRMLKGDEQSNGRVVYRANKMSVAILCPKHADTTKVKTVKPQNPAVKEDGKVAA